MQVRHGAIVEGLGILEGGVVLSKIRQRLGDVPCAVRPPTVHLFKRTLELICGVVHHVGAGRDALVRHPTVKDGTAEHGAAMHARYRFHSRQRPNAEHADDISVVEYREDGAERGDAALRADSERVLGVEGKVPCDDAVGPLRRQVDMLHRGEDTGIVEGTEAHTQCDVDLLLRDGGDDAGNGDEEEKKEKSPADIDAAHKGLGSQKKRALLCLLGHGGGAGAHCGGGGPHDC